MRLNGTAEAEHGAGQGRSHLQADSAVGVPRPLESERWRIVISEHRVEGFGLASDHQKKIGEIAEIAPIPKAAEMGLTEDRRKILHDLGLRDRSPHLSAIGELCEI